MILLIALSIGVFVGFNAEWVTIGKDTGAFFKDCGFADYRIIDEDGISPGDVDKIRDIKGVTGVSRFFSVNTDVKGSDDQLALAVTESEHTSGFVLTEGEEYDRWDPEGFWLMDKYAELNGIKPGDSLTVTFGDMEFTGTVRGLIESAEFLICVRDESQVMPDFNTYGYVYAAPAMLRKVIGQQIRKDTADKNQPKSASCVQIKPQTAAEVADKLSCDHGRQRSESFQRPVDETGEEKSPQKSAGDTGKGAQSALKPAENRRADSAQQ
jgi:putative ABC transport system permease protein